MADLRIRSFEPADVDDLHFAPGPQRRLAGLADWRHSMRMAEQAGPAWAATLDGHVIGLGGFGLMWPGRCNAWAAVGCEIPPWAWIGLHRGVLERMGQLPAIGIRRVEAETLHGYDAAARWVRMLGFEWECLSRAFGPDGRDYDRWARIL
ncbi:MAG: hypothetical protein P4L83_21185 [Nevskia sp.]|nr:hypothetical protein [Nevskia sp.]